MSLDSLEGLLRAEERTVSGHEKIYSAMEEDARDILRNPVFQEYYTSRNYTHQELKCIDVYNLGTECLKIQMDRMGITAHFWINNNSAETNLKNLDMITLSLIRNIHRIKFAEPSGAKKGGGYSIKQFNKYNALVKERKEAFTALNDGKSKDEVTADEDWSDENEDCNGTPKINKNLVLSRMKTESNNSGFLYDPNCNTATENGSQIDPYLNHRASVILKPKANPTLWSKTDPKFSSVSGSSSELCYMSRVKSNPNSNSIHEIKPNTDLNDNSGLLSDSSPKLGQKIEPSSKGDSRDSGLNARRNSVFYYDLKKTETSLGVPPSQPPGQLEPESDEDEFEPALKNIQENLSLADALKIPAVCRKIYMKKEPVPQSRKPLGVFSQFEDPKVQDSKQQNNAEIIDCICNRSIRMIHCGLCGLTLEGRTRKVCDLHSNVTYLHDFTACPRCKIGLNHLKEYCLPTVSQKTSSGHPTVEKKPSSCPSK